MADLSQTIAIIFQGQDRATGEIDKVERGLLDVEKAGRSVGTLPSALDGVVGSLGRVGGILATVFAGFSVAALVREFVDANVELEKFTKAVVAISGSTQNAGPELAYLREVSERLGLSVKETSGAYISFLAATKGTALAGQPARDIFESIASAMSLLGKSSAETEGALLAVQQMISKGKISSEELRGQLGERLPGAFQIAARSIGVTTAELGSMLEAGQLLSTDFLPGFAKELNATFGDPSRVDSYTAAMNRFGNAASEALQNIGQQGGGLGTGAIDLLAQAVRRVGIEAQNQVGSWSNLLYVIRGGSWDVFVEKQKALGIELEGQAATLDLKYNQSLAETNRLLRDNAEAAKAAFPDQFRSETERLTRQANLLTTQLNDQSEALKFLKINTEEVNRSTADYASALVTLGRSNVQSDAVFLKGVEEASKHIRAGTNDVTILRDALSDAGVVGARNGDTLAKAFKLVNDGADAAAKKGSAYSDVLKKQADEAKRAEEAQERLRLELEKLASNERIKLIEARVQLNVADVQEQTKRIQAAFESLDNTVNSTADVINKAFGMLAGDQTFLDSITRGKLFEQLDRENANRDRALKMQEQLTQAQIDVLRQQARQMERGDALIKVDAAGLEPHLEAILWELLKKAQIRTNRDGLRTLLGVT